MVRFESETRARDSKDSEVLDLRTRMIYIVDLYRDVIIIMGNYTKGYALRMLPKVCIL